MLTLTSNRPIPQDSQPLSDHIPDKTQIVQATPMPSSLPIQQQRKTMTEGQSGKENPLGHLRTMDARAGRQGDVGMAVDGMIDDMINTGRDEVD